MSLSDVHSRLYIACLIYSLAVGGWAFYLSYKNRDLDSNFWGALAINEILFVAVAILDVVLYLNGSIVPERPAVHFLYTATGILTIPAAYTFTRQRATAREAGVYGAVCLFLAGIAIRAIITTVV
jgi:hypothetical protein